jgi:TetR/AcrR family transcriptional repressor of nem operon
MIGHIWHVQAKTSREKLIEDGLSLIWKSGFNGTSMSDIAEKAAILKGSFYNYFKSKEEYVMAILETYSASWENTITLIFKNQKLALRNRLEIYFENMKQMAKSMHFVQGSFVGNLSQEMSGMSEKFANRFEKIFTSIQSKIAESLKEAQENGQLSTSENPDFLAEMILNSTEGALLRVKSSRSLRPLEVLEQFLMQKLALD